MSACCRFCLEEGSTRENPLLQPCACRGTGGFVHWRCLRQWALTDLTQSHDICPVCKTHYNVQVVPRFEETAFTRSAALVLVENIGTLGGVLQALVFTYLQSRMSYMPIEHNIYGALCISHAVIQPLFILALYNLCSVRNPSLYFQKAIKSFMPLLVLFHTFLYYNLVARQDIFFGSTLLLVMNCHWREHQKVLRAVNRALLLD